MISKCGVLIIIIGIFLSLVGPVRAQSNWMLDRNKKIVSIEWLKPSFSEDRNLTFFTSVFNVSARLPMNDRNTMVVEIPYGKYGYEYKDEYYGIDYSRKESTIGNVYLGAEFGQPNDPVFTEVGVRLPTVSDDKYGAQSVGMLADWDRLDAFVDDIVPFTVKVNSLVRRESGFVTRVRIGPEIWYITNKDSEDRFEMFLLYSFHGGLETETFGMGLGLNGRMWVTMGEGSDLAEKTIHQLDFNFFGKIKNIRPGVYMRVPVDDDLEEVLDSVLGIRLDFDLR